MSVPPETESNQVSLPKACCVHSNMGAVRIAPVDKTMRRDSKGASFTVKEIDYIICEMKTGYSRGSMPLPLTSERNRGPVPKMVTLNGGS